MFIADTSERAAFITGLRELADYLAANPTIPVPPFGRDISFHVDDTEDGGCQQVHEIAQMLGVAVTDETPDGGHCYASKVFGLIEYRVVSVPASNMARYRAMTSYDGCVDPQ